MTNQEPESTGAGRRFEAAEAALFDAVGMEIRSRPVELDAPLTRTHVVEAGPGDGDRPLVFVHGTAQFAGFLAPLMARAGGRRVIAFDRPGYGRSSAFEYDASSLAGTLVDVVGGVLDALDLDDVDLVGHSMGGVAALRYARAEPDRVNWVAAFGALPGFPGTRPPVQIRLLTAPAVGRALRRLQPAGEAGVLAVADVFGERDTMPDHPALIRAIAAHEAIPRAARAGLSEFRALARLRGWRPAARLEPALLREVRVPVDLVVGTADPLGGPRRLRAGVDCLPDARLASVEAGHLPFLGHPERCAELLTTA